MAETEPPRTETQQADGTALAQGWLENSQFVSHLGIEVDAIEADHAVLSMPFTDKLPTLGNVVHGGAISSLIDTAAAAAAWSGAVAPDRPRASTVGITVDFLAPARGQGVTAEARVVRRGGSGLCFCQVSATTEDGAQVALALVTYQL